MEWVLLALLGAVATSLTTILAKIGIKNVNSNFATFYRTGIVIIGALIMTLCTGSVSLFFKLSWQNYLFLGLSGIMTGCSWLCYYRALKLGNVNKVAPIDKSSFILTSILFLIFFFDDTTKNGNPLTIGMLILSMVLMLIGTLLMIGKRRENNDVISPKYLIYAIFSAVFASLVAFLIKLGLKGIPSDLGTLIRTIIVFIFAGTIVLSKKEYKGVKQISKSSWIFLTLSGVMTGVAWISEHYAYNAISASPVAVNSIGKLSILLTMVFSYFILKEKFTWKTLFGLILLTIGIILIIIFSL